ncbi:MAG: chorismate synthase [Dehalococcoidia bacterium]|nr:chorismate synthase [Dehalococcoidia bacterium]
MANSIGKLFTVTSFGESHGQCVGTVIDGCPAGLPLTVKEIQRAVDKRKPEAAAGGTARKEEDRVEVLSGLFKGYTTGAPLCMLTWNKNIDSSVYDEMRVTPRPGHADYAAFAKYSGFNDYRGGGRFSGRITAGFVMAGAVAARVLQSTGIEIAAYTVQIGPIQASPQTVSRIKRNVYKDPVRCADPAAGAKMLDVIEKVRRKGDSIGGAIEIIALNVPAGLGEPVFDTLEGDLAKAYFAIPAVKGVEFGSGFAAAAMKGSEHNDPLTVRKRRIVTLGNNSGGISGGISNGMPLTARIAFKPTASIALPQKTINLETGKNVGLAIRGRHDACIVPRAVPVVEAMTAIVLCDFALREGLIPGVIE